MCDNYYATALRARIRNPPRLPASNTLSSHPTISHACVQPTHARFHHLLPHGPIERVELLPHGRGVHTLVTSAVRTPCVVSFGHEVAPHLSSTHSERRPGHPGVKVPRCRERGHVLESCPRIGCPRIPRPRDVHDTQPRSVRRGKTRGSACLGVSTSTYTLQRYTHIHTRARGRPLAVIVVWHAPRASACPRWTGAATGRSPRHTWSLPAAAKAPYR